MGLGTLTANTQRDLQTYNVQLRMGALLCVPLKKCAHHAAALSTFIQNFSQSASVNFFQTAGSRVRQNLPVKNCKVGLQVRKFVETNSSLMETNRSFATKSLQPFRTSPIISIHHLLQNLTNPQVRKPAGCLTEWHCNISQKSFQH